MTAPTAGRVNEWTVRFANVNGSGSASANQLFAQSLFRMGLPISIKNIFPSNIQGAPTWYEVRVSERGWRARGSQIHLMVAMNAQTYQQDLQALAPGGVFFYDNSFERQFDRSDVLVIGAPLARICLEEFGNVKQRHMFRNIACCGLLSELVGIDPAVQQASVEKMFASKPRLVQPNVDALMLGRKWAAEHPSALGGAQFPLAVRASEAAADSILVSGNETAGLGCVYAGATVAAWYPITPSTSLAEAFEKYCRRYRTAKDGVQRYAIVQAEDELAAAGIAVGAGWNGARAFTATSGPGISLMSEFLGLAYFAEVPLVLFNIQRGGPSTGMPTRTQQSDILACAYASHGDTLHPMLFPEDPKECFDMAAEAFNLADRLQTPVMVMSDLDIGMNEWICEPLQWDSRRKWDRGKVMTAEMLDKTPQWGRYLDSDGDGIPWRSLPGTHPDLGAYLTRGTSHDDYGRYTEDGAVHAENLDRLKHKWQTAQSLVPEPQWLVGSGKRPASSVLVYFGSTSVAIPEAMELLQEAGVAPDRVRLLAFPFHRQLAARLNRYRTVLVIEQNRDGQMGKLLVTEGGLSPDRLRCVCMYDGMPVTAADLAQKVLQALSMERKQSGEQSGEQPGAQPIAASL